MDFQGFPKISRYSRDCCVTEKIDGTNGQILIAELPSNEDQFIFEQAYGTPLRWVIYPDGLLATRRVAVYAGSRNRWLDLKADNFGFAKWVYENAEELQKLGPGRHYGEWWGQGIQREYGLKEKRFSLFNTRKWNDPAVRPACCHVVPTIAIGEFHSTLVEQALSLLRENGSYASPGYMNPEGIIIFHTAGNLLFKKTLKNDEKGKEE